MDSEKLLYRLGYFAAAAYLVVGVVGGFWPGHWDNSSGTDRALWIILMAGGAAVLVAGLRLLPHSRWRGAILVSVGAFFGALPIFWTGIALVLAVVIVVLAVRHAREPGRARRRAEPIA